MICHRERWKPFWIRASASLDCRSKHDVQFRSHHQLHYLRNKTQVHFASLICENICPARWCTNDAAEFLYAYHRSNEQIRLAVIRVLGQGRTLLIVFSNEAIRQPVQFRHNGKFGQLQYVVGTGYIPRKSIGKLDQPLKIPSHIDYDLRCGSAAKVDLYRPKPYYDWHGDFNIGAGDIGNSGVHEMDVAGRFLSGAGLPRRMMSVDGHVGYGDTAETPNTEVTYLGYDTAPLIFETRGLPG